ncbi:DNA recombination protein RmuC [Nocardioides sp. TF02-7]|uniref:DNA recombination protein RmuC n=1 Tax=Nocardioides sp. TF02-7 TaxID=2917724 RepID=UPI001F053B5F|nr:DNA recombination protein RmuC [Nocardioides sp. TF02-7]UMG92543.1 DNA recombination protein RmuC [Nocardioides sp. TF02-7]
MELVVLVVGLVAGAVTAWVVATRHHAQAAAQALTTLEAEHQQALTMLETEHQHALTRLEAEHQHELTRLEAEQAAERTDLLSREREARAEVQAELAAAMASLDELRQALDAAREQHRELVAEQRARQAERERTESGHTQVLKTLTPVRESLQEMRRRVDELEKQRSVQHGQLAEQLRSTQESVAESKKAADTLAAALTNNAVRGVWGETQLRTLVESAGLLSRVDFELQHTITADSGSRRPDMVINLPGGKQMAIDAKVPYNAFIDAHRDGIDPAERQRLLVDHAKKVRAHVDALAGKSYWTGLKASPEFTIAFIPNEQLLATALETDPSLMEYAFGKGVVLATPTNLWAILKTVAFTWRQDVLTDDAKQLFDLGRELYRRIVTMAEHADKLRRSLESTIKSYNAFAGSLETRVLVTARKLDQMDESAVIPRPAMIDDVAPRALTSGDFEVIADLERDELDLGLELPGHTVEAVEAEIVEDERKHA